jgi:hypothetical protein
VEFVVHSEPRDLYRCNAQLPWESLLTVGDFSICSDNSGHYANLFGIILAMESIQNEFLNGTLGSEERDRVFQSLRKNFEAVRKALGLSVEGVRGFAKACNLQCNLSFAAMENESSLPAGAPAAVELGTTFTTLSDLCSLRTGDAQYYVDLITKIRHCCTALKIHEDPEVRQLGDKWYSAFGALRPDQEPNLDLTRALKADIQPWLDACQRVLRTR